MIELASVIRDLREELERAVAAAEGAALRFELETVELEVSVAVERSSDVGARARFWVLEANSGTTAAATSTQRLTLALRPTLQGASGPPYVRGAAAPYER